MLIQDDFLSYQGTGHLTGKLQYFVRFAGCSVRCPIRSVCDEQDALTTSGAVRVDPRDMADHVYEKVGPTGWVCITGGEPCEQPEALTEFGIACERLGIRIHLFTSGTLQVPIRTDWLTVSPKCDADGLQWNRRLWAQEMVVVYDPKWVTSVDMLRKMKDTTSCYDYYLCPLFDGVGYNTEDVHTALDVLNAGRPEWDMTCQAHRIWGIK